MRTPICDQLGIDIPLFAFSHCRDVVAKVSKAGGFGVLGALAFSGEQLEMELNWIDEHVDGKPYGVDIVMPAKFVGKGEGFEVPDLEAMIPEEHKQFRDRILEQHGVPPLPDDFEIGERKAAGLGGDTLGFDHVDISLQHPVKMLVNALGPPPKEVIDRAHEHGILVGGLCGSVVHAERQVNMGVDVIVAQGTEAGGHCGEIATMVLIPEVVDAVGDRATVLAAGGVGTGRQMAAAMALGADGVWTGSIWLAVTEADTHPDAVENILRATSRDAVRSRAMTGKPARQLRTPWTEAWDNDPESPGPLPMPLQGLLFQPAALRIIRAKNRELHGWPAGQIIGRIDRVRRTKDVVAEMIEEFIETTERLKALTEG